jgi:hypothetical protein
MPAEMLMAMLWTFRDGKEARMDMHSDPPEALKAVGLEEWAERSGIAPA